MSVATFANPQKAGPVRLQWPQRRPEAMVIGLFVSITAALAIAGAGGALRLMYPSLAVLTALFLFFRSKPAYVSFVIWIWFLSSFVRRLADFRAGFQETSLILLTPYLVTAVSGLLLARHPRGLAEKRNLPVLLALLAILYGFGVGLLRYTITQMVPALLGWLAPLCIAYLIIESRNQYEELKDSIQSAFLIGALVMGLYAIYQFFVMPPWDRLWLESVPTLTFGLPEPMQVRDFGTMNAPVVFGLTMTAILLMALGSKRKLRFVAGPIGLLGLILTLNRSAWLGFLAGSAYIVTRLPNRERVRIMFAVFVFVALAGVGAKVPGVSEILSTRLGTFVSPSQDSSYQARVEGYGKAFATLAIEPFGEGIGSPDIDHPTDKGDDSIGPHDSTFLELLYSVGWFGTVCYLSGLGVVVVRSFENRTSRGFEVAFTAVLIAFATQCVLNIVLSGPIGIFFWIAASLMLVHVELSNNRTMQTRWEIKAGLTA